MPTLKVSVDPSGAQRGAITASNSIKSIGEQATTSTAHVRTFDKSLDNIKSTSLNVARSIATMAGAFSAAMIIRDLTRTAIGFEASMSELQSVTRANAEAMKAMSDEARKMGAETKYSASEASESLTFLARAGFAVQDAIAALPSTLNLAAAGMLSLGEAGDVASNVLSQFNLKASQMNRVSDVMVQTANNANTNVRMLAESFNYVGPIAGSLGKSIEETAAAVGVLGNSGIQASQAGTNLRGILASLLDPTAEARDAIAELGLKVEELNPATNSLSTIFSKLHGAMMNPTQALQIFNKLNAASAIILAGNVDALDKLTEANYAAAGAAEKAAKVMSDNLAGSLKTLRSTIEEVYLKVGESGFTGEIRHSVDVITEAIRIYSGMSNGVNELGGSAEQLIGTIEALIATFAAMKAAQFAGFLHTAAIEMTTVGRAAITATYQVNALSVAMNMQAATASVSGLAAAWRGLTIAIGTNPLGALITALGIAGTAFALFGKHTNEATDAMRRFKQATADVDSLVESFQKQVFAYQEDAAEGALKYALDGSKSILAAYKNIIREIQFSFEKLNKTEISFDNLKKLSSTGLAGFEVEKFGKQYWTKFYEQLLTAQNSADVSSVMESARKYFAFPEFTPTPPTIASGGGPSAILTDSMRFQSDMKAALNLMDKFTLVNIDSQDALEALEAVLKLTSEQVKDFDDAMRDATENEQKATDVQTNHNKVRITTTKLAHEEAAALRNLNKEREDSFQKLKADLELQNQLVGKTDIQKRLAILQRESGASYTPTQLEEIKALLAQNEILERAEQLGAGIGNAFGNAFEKILFDGASFKEAMKSLFSDLLRQLYQQLVVSAFVKMFSNLFVGAVGGGSPEVTNPGPNTTNIGLEVPSARGNAFFGGEVIPMGTGGIIDRPTLFNMSGNKRALVGEMGNEAVMPLTRDSRGRLAVHAKGSEGNNRIINLTMNVNGVSNADSFRLNERSILKRIDRSLRDA